MRLYKCACGHKRIAKNPPLCKCGKAMCLAPICPSPYAIPHPLGGFGAHTLAALKRRRDEKQKHS